MRSLLLHVVGKEFKLPTVLKQCLLTKWERRDMGRALRGHFLRTAVAVARGASLRCGAVMLARLALLAAHKCCCCRRDELRAAFPTLQLSREAVHAFASMSRRAHVPSSYGAYAPYATPFGALRAAQLVALGISEQTAFLTLPWLLPPEPCADADEEKLLLVSARFLVQRGAFREDDIIMSTSRDETFIYSEQFTAQLQDAGYPFARTYDESEGMQPLADIGFLVFARARAAEAANTPLRDAFSFRGRTLLSLTQLAMQHRREALLAAAVANGGRPRQDPPLWRLPLAWDGECAARLTPHIDRLHRERCSLPSCEWVDTLHTVVPGLPHLRGRWRMQQLLRMRDVLLEGTQQRNCLRHIENVLARATYWSLRFTPEADAVRALGKVTRAQLALVLAAQRHTVCLEDGYLQDFKGPRNAAPTRAAARALAHWAPAGLDLDRPVVHQGDDEDDDDDGEEEAAAAGER